VSVQAVSRRVFLQGAVAVGAAMMLPRGVFAAGVLTACDHFALMSDVHVSGGMAGGMAKRLSVAVEQVLALPERPRGVLIAGDCAYLSGKVSDYGEYVRRIRPLVEAGIPLHMTMGNHDQRERFWEVLPGERAVANAKLRRQSMVVEGQNANWLLLDSLNKTNANAGELGKDQLEWLAAELDARAGKPAVVMLHHDPVRKGGGERGSLMDSGALMAIVRPRRQVKALFWGHTHVWDVSRDVSGIQLVNLPATGYRLWGRSFLGWVDCQVYAGNAALRVHTLDAGRQEDGWTYQLRWRA